MQYNIWNVHFSSTYNQGDKKGDQIALVACVAYMRQWIGSALVPIMACCLFGTKPLS